MKTRKEMVTLLVEDQIKRGVVKPKNKELQINARLNGPLKMSWMDLHDYIVKYNLGGVNND